jgi:hypothetical protein
MTLAQTLAEHWVLILVLFSMVWAPLVWNIIKHTRAYRKEVRDLEENEVGRLAETGAYQRSYTQSDLEQMTAAVERGCCSMCGAPPSAEHAPFCGAKS